MKRVEDEEFSLVHEISRSPLPEQRYPRPGYWLHRHPPLNEDDPTIVEVTPYSCGIFICQLDHWGFASVVRSRLV
ncbi:hypothetical protein PROFUN_04260 [Planoprotostelium fungivorum]|uniref:Uncharacterized protein n=1 Tax=Planoprotostelium fungivorum TaxID=1890364 RepID=A0A2P6NV36_9EUKA|nr:hypothetical protein PROFUN_04260 [Planoprotostelium fungivorum]